MTFVFATFIGVWRLLTATGLVSPIILPSPLETLDDLAFVSQNPVTGGYMAPALWTMLKTIFYGYMPAILIGFSLGVLGGETAFGEPAVMPYLVGLNATLGMASSPTR